MSIPDFILPKMWLGGALSDYRVEMGSGNGLISRHIKSGAAIPHVTSKVSQAVFNSTMTSGIKMLLANGKQTTATLSTISAVTAKTATMAKAGVVVSSVGAGAALLALGVGVWAAWNIHQTRKTVDRIEGKVDALGASVDALHGSVGALHEKTDRLGEMVALQHEQLTHLINYNGALLGVILENQGNLAAGLEQLSEQIDRGFRSVLESLENVEARRQAQELDTQMRTIHHYYSTCTEAIRGGKMPANEDLRAIVDNAVVLQAWLDTRLSEIKPGQADRLPYITAKAFALRQEIDARSLLEHTPEARDRDTSELREIIATEIRTLTTGNILDVATQHSVLVENYVYLRRALGRSPSTMVEFEDGQVLPFFATSMLHWDDRLNSLRELAPAIKAADADEYELNTLAETRAWAALRGSSRVSRKVSTRDVQHVLGVGNEGIDEESFRVVLDFAAKDLEEHKLVVKRELNDVG